MCIGAHDALRFRAPTYVPMYEYIHIPGALRCAARDPYFGARRELEQGFMRLPSESEKRRKYAMYIQFARTPCCPKSRWAGLDLNRSARVRSSSRYALAQ